MKKLLQAITCILLMAATVLTVSAAESAEMTIGAAKNKAVRGDTLDFTVTVSETEDCIGVDFTLVYDDTVFEFVGGSCSLAETAAADFSAGVGTFIYESGKTLSGEIFTFQLKVKEEAAFGEYTVSANASIRDSNGENSVTVNAFAITVDCDHSFDEWTKVDDTNHKRICQLCQEEQIEKHVWDDVTILQQATCKEGGRATYSCSSCDAEKTEDTNPNDDHVYGNCEQVDDAGHKHVCTVCEKEEILAHTWGEGTIIKQGNCLENVQMQYSCTACGATKIEDTEPSSNHKYTNACDTICDLCGESREITHSYKDTWNQGPTQHWHACSVCREKTDVTDHTPGPEPTDKNPQVCTVCNYILKPALGHEHDYAQAWSTDDNGHWHTCSGCEEKDGYAVHEFENACDPDCATCGYTRTVTHNYGEAWEKDKTGHWHVCSECGKKTDVIPHAPGPEATTTAAQTCTDCGHEIAPILQPKAPEPIEKNNRPATEWAYLAIILILCGITIIVIGKKQS